MRALIDGYVGSLFCKACGQTKPTKDFHKYSSSSRGYAYYCKQCATEKSRVWHKNNKDNTLYHEARRESYFKLKYGITLEKREELLKQQDYKCAICFTELLKNGGATHIDHCHSTGKIRGMLCTNCNRGLGHFQDNKEFLMRAVKYLEQGESQ